jgi:hypothetical protein
MLSGELATRPDPVAQQHAGEAILPRCCRRRAPKKLPLESEANSEIAYAHYWAKATNPVAAWDRRSKRSCKSRTLASPPEVWALNERRMLEWAHYPISMVYSLGSGRVPCELSCLRRERCAVCCGAAPQHGVRLSAKHFKHRRHISSRHLGDGPEHRDRRDIGAQPRASRRTATLVF